MSENVHVHTPHEFSESERGTTSRSERVMELVATLLLAFATLGIAWSGYQGARWSGQQAQEYSASNGARAHANRAAIAGVQDRTQDLLNFNRWLEVTTDGNQELADLYQRRFRPEFLPAFDAWLASDPLHNPNAESSPLREAQYKVANLERSTALDHQGDVHFENARKATEHTDNYVLTTVFFATVLFFAGISMRFVWQSMRIAVLVLGSLSLVWAILLLARLPIL
ncbi:MAG TPA: hypothetical protein VKI01_09275 [Acidimicrobiia bacterium]|nr:hypothetical protein [Acidimicrobiia bacterium]